MTLFCESSWSLSISDVICPRAFKKSVTEPPTGAGHQWEYSVLPGTQQGVFAAIRTLLKNTIQTVQMLENMYGRREVITGTDHC